MLNGVIYILLPVHNRREITLGFIRCLLAQEDRNFHLVVIDDGSTDGTADSIQQILPSATILKGDGNLWWAGALQKGYEWLKQKEITSQDLVLIMNDDVEIGKDYLKNGRALLNEYPGYQIGSYFVEKETGNVLDQGSGCDFDTLQIYQTKDEGQLVFMSTRGLFIPGKAFLKSGGFIPKIFPHYFSDYEFTHRLLRDHGLKMKPSSQVPVFGICDRSGITSLKNRSPKQAWKIMLSNRWTDNPIICTRIVRMYCPVKNQPKLILRIWMSFFRRWLLTFPKFVFLPLFLIIFPALGFLRGLNAAVKSQRYGEEP